jgi:hypothetical protein
LFSSHDAVQERCLFAPEGYGASDAAARATSRDEETRLLAEAAELDEMGNLLEQGGDKPGASRIIGPPKPPAKL